LPCGAVVEGVGVLTGKITVGTMTNMTGVAVGVGVALPVATAVEVAVGVDAMLTVAVAVGVAVIAALAVTEVDEFGVGVPVFAGPGVKVASVIESMVASPTPIRAARPEIIGVTMIRAPVRP
jgi:hypothetical protein